MLFRSVNTNVLQRWRREFRQTPGNAFPGNGQRRWSEGRVAELERKIGQRLHSALGYLPPVEFELKAEMEAAARQRVA